MQILHNSPSRRPRLHRLAKAGLILLGWSGLALNSPAAASALAPPTERIAMMLDADMFNEVDDQFALAFAVRSPERIDLKAVYAAPFKNHRARTAEEGMEKSYHETVRVLKLLNHPSDGLVFRGSRSYLPDRNTPVDSPAARHLIKLSHEEREGPLYVVGLGAASNLASALLMDPSITNRIVMVWIGGQPHGWRRAHDFNLEQDIPAAQVLFDSGVPLVHIPANVAARLSITLPELEKGLKGKSIIADALYQNVEEYYVETRKNRDVPRSGRGAWTKVIWDIATIAWLLEGDASVTSELVAAPVLNDAGEWTGAKRNHQVRVATQLSRDRIYKGLFEKLSE